MTTKDRMLTAAIDLFAEKGYKAVTTKQIAKVASVNEVTLFRYFGSKQKLFEEALHKFNADVEVRKIFEKEIVWDLEKDLLFISKMYRDLMNKNKKIIRITIKDFIGLKEIEQPGLTFPRELKEILAEYFLEMQKRGKVIEGDPEMLAVIFLNTYFGEFVSFEVAKNGFTEISSEDFMMNSIQIFVKGFTP